MWRFANCGDLRPEPDHQMSRLAAEIAGHLVDKVCLDRCEAFSLSFPSFGDVAQTLLVQGFVRFLF